MNLISIVSIVALPLFVGAVITHGLVKKVAVYDEFISGARSGIGLAFRVMPYIIGMVFAIDIFKASGCFDYISAFIGPVLNSIGIPPEVLPLALMRPFSGGASLGLLAGIFTRYGPDSYVGRVSSTMMGSSETLFYTVALYFGSVGVTKTRYTIPVGLAVEVVGLIASCLVCRFMFQ